LDKETLKKSKGSESGESDSGLSDLARAYQKAAPYLAASTTLVAAVAVLGAGGYWLDKRMGNERPWFFIAGALIGMVGGFIGFFRTVLVAGRQK
jgi:F0F1-type ATP synthase assembly protein I